VPLELTATWGALGGHADDWAEALTCATA
jgi:hypothetical protein